MDITTLLTFVTVLALFAIIGLSSVVQKKKTTKDYLLAGQDVRPWLVALATAATCNSGYMFIGHSESLHGISDSFKLVHFERALAYRKE